MFYYFLATPIKKSIMMAYLKETFEIDEHTYLFQVSGDIVALESRRNDDFYLVGKKLSTEVNDIWYTDDTVINLDKIQDEMLSLYTKFEDIGLDDNIELKLYFLSTKI